MRSWLTSPPKNRFSIASAARAQFQLSALSLTSRAGCALSQAWSPVCRSLSRSSIFVSLCCERYGTDCVTSAAATDGPSVASVRVCAAERAALPPSPTAPTPQKYSPALSVTCISGSPTMSSTAVDANVSLVETCTWYSSAPATGYQCSVTWPG